MIFIIFFLVAFFNPWTIGSANNTIIDLLPLLLFGIYIIRRNYKWYIIIIVILLIRLVVQLNFFNYRSPYIYGDIVRFTIFIGSCFAFTALFKDQATLNRFAEYAWKISWIFIIVILIAYIFKIDLLSIDYQNRWVWYAFSQGGGPNFSVVFTFLGLLRLYYLNERYPVSNLKIRINNIIKMFPYLLLCILGGTRIDLFIFILAMLIYLRPSKIFYVFFLIGAFLIPYFINLLSSIPSFGRIESNPTGDRFLIWYNFYNIILNNKSAFWFGFGPGGIMVNLFDFSNKLTTAYLYQTHNMFLQIWLNYGVIMLIIIFILYLMFIFKIINKGKKNAIIFSILGFVLLNELFDGTYLFIGCQWVFAASYALLFNSINVSVNKKVLN